jgi:hypothetical protein
MHSHTDRSRSRITASTRSLVSSTSGTGTCVSFSARAPRNSSQSVFLHIGRGVWVTLTGSMFSSYTTGRWSAFAGRSPGAVSHEMNEQRRGAVQNTLSTLV